MAPPRGGGHRGSMHTPRSRRAGTTLVELLTVLALAGLLLGLAGPPIAAARDRVAAAAARDAVASALERARGVAIARGGARLLVGVSPPRAHVVTAAGEAAAPPLDLDGDYGVRIITDGAAVPLLELRFDSYGIGRMTSRTVRFRRGAAEARLTVSAYGRARRW